MGAKNGNLKAANMNNFVVSSCSGRYWHNNKRPLYFLEVMNSDGNKIGCWTIQAKDGFGYEVQGVINRFIINQWPKR